MPDTSLTEQMRADWNERAQEDAFYYVAFGRRGQDAEEFLLTGADVVRSLEAELARLPAGDKRQRRALEIGCGPGRLMLPMSWNFGEIHGVDVSDQMIRLAVRTLHDIPNAFPRATRGSDLSVFPAEFFDFVYSYAVFQHIPSREVVFNYLQESRRVLKTGGILRCQFNGLPKSAKEYTTWAGVRIGAGEIAEFACDNDMQLLALEGVSTQYMWTTLRKQPEGWFAGVAANRPAPAEPATKIRNVCNSHSGEPAVPARGRFASVAIWIENLPADCDLNQINVTADGLEAAPVYIGPPVFDGLVQVNALLPAELRTGLVPVELYWCGEPLVGPTWIHVISPGPPVPRIVSLTDGVNLLSGPVILSRSVKVDIEELTDPARFAVSIDGAPLNDLDVFCTDPRNERYEINFELPAGVAPGPHQVEASVGRRRFPPVPIDVK
ncbi:MAG: methyltransferase domain-containing protein [Bryobacteraceae bacterium]